MPTNVENLESRPLKSTGNKAIKLYVYEMKNKQGKLLGYVPAKTMTPDTQYKKYVKEIPDGWVVERIPYFLGVKIYNTTGYEERHKVNLKLKVNRKENKKMFRVGRLKARAHILENIKNIDEKINDIKKIISIFDERERFLKKFATSIKTLNEGKMIDYTSTKLKLESMKRKKQFLIKKKESIKLFRNKPLRNKVVTEVKPVTA